MASRSASAAALLVVVFQAATAYVVPEVVMMRMKRNPEPMRSFSYSGFNPNGQMSAFTGLVEYPMFGGSYGSPSQSGPFNYGPQPATQDSYGPPQATQDSYGPPPSGVAGQQQTVPAAAADSANKQQYGGSSTAGSQQQPQEYGPPKSGVPADSREQGNNSVEQADNKKQYRGRDGPSSNAEASFNAWFPIMFGVFPNGAGDSNGQSGNRSNNNQRQSQDHGNSYGGNGYERSSGTTVIANSVSNGRHGVATSHAIAYGNPRSSQN